MDTENLDKWAAEFNGEQTEEEVADAVAAKFYTGSPAAAFAVLVKVSKDTPVSVGIGNGTATVNVGGATRTGKVARLGELIIEACKEFVGGSNS
jgi:hypothetical protein